MKLDYLKNIPIFSNLSSKQRNLIQSCCRNITVSTSKVILYQEEQSYDLYIILSGKVKVSLINKSGREVILDTLTDGDFFGELSLFDEKPRSATVTAMSSASIMVLPRDAFMGIIKKNLDIMVNLLTVMAMRLRNADERIETLAFVDVYGRVAKTLIDIAKSKGKVSSDGFIAIQGPTHQMIADQIGASREAVTKAFKSLVASGLIIVNGREITITPKQFNIL